VKAYNNLGLPLILSDEPKVDNKSKVMPTIFLILGTATIMVDFQYTCVLGTGHSNDNTKKSMSSSTDYELKVTSYTIYVAGSNRALVNKLYSTQGIALSTAYKDAYGELSGIYDSAVSKLKASISEFDTVIWRCDNATKA
jgi:hypothetical protein